MTAVGAAVLRAVALAGHLTVLWPMIRWQRARVQAGAAQGLDHAARLGFVNDPPRSRRRSPDFQYVVRARHQPVHRVLDDFR